MRPLFAVAIAILADPTSTVFADRAGGPVEPLRPAAEQPCSGTKARAIVGRYMCQLAQNGTWTEPIACEIVADGKHGFLRMTRLRSCNLTGDVKRGKLDGALWCDPSEPDQIGEEGFVNTELVRIPGGFRAETIVEVVKSFANGPDDNRTQWEKTVRLKLALNVCRRPWPTPARR